MKTTQYVRQERAIVAADSGGIRERWFWGLRILRDPEAMTPSAKSLRHGVAQELIHAAARAGLTLSDREIQRRIQCARTYKTEAEIRQALTDFTSWDRLLNAGFPTYPAPDDEALADHRTEAEKQHDRSRALLDLVGPQAALFPLDTFEPTVATLKDLIDYADEQDALTERFLAHGRKRRDYLDQLVDAAGGDTSMTWEAASQLLPPDVADPLADTA